jgi:hypothetical protein
MTRAIVAVVAVALALVVLAALVLAQSGDEPESSPTPTSGVPPTLDPVFDEIDRALAAQPLASAAFNAPTELRLGDAAVIQLLLSLSKPLDDLQAELREIGEREGARIRVAPLMEARLTGSGFRVEALTPEIQPVGRRTDTEWSWEVEGTEGGSQRLHLSLAALITVEGERTPRAVRTFDREIEVNVTVNQRITGFIGDNWQWLWAALVVPLLGLAAGLVKSRRRRPEEAAQTRYVQGPRSRTWHWCRNCSNYPSTIATMRPARPPTGLCKQCEAKEADGNCRS